MSSHQQDLPDTTLLCRCLSLGRFTEWQFQANRDYQLAISHSFGHEFERFPIELREYENHLYRRVLRSVLWHLDNRSKHSSRLDLGDQLRGGSSADRIRHSIERQKIRDRSVVVGCDHLICTHLEEKNGRFTGRIEGAWPYGDTKALLINHFAEQHGVDFTASYAYADHHTDEAVLALFGNPVVVNPRTKMQQIAAGRQWPTREFR